MTTKKVYEVSKEQLEQATFERRKAYNKLSHKEAEKERAKRVCIQNQRDFNEGSDGDLKSSPKSLQH